MKLQCLTRYDDTGASSRVRFAQYRAPLAQLLPDWQIERQSLLDSRYLERKYAVQSVAADASRCYAARARAVAAMGRGGIWWLEKELWPWAPAWLERGLLRRQPFVIDLDDAIFHNYDLHDSAAVRALYGRKIDHLMAAATLVTAGNDYIAQRARAAGAPWVEVLPTVVDLDRYPDPAANPAAAATDGILRIGWIGSPTTTRYLAGIAPALRQLAGERRIRLVAIGAGALEMPGVDVERLPWQQDAEAEMLRRCDIGVMPLDDTPWERGKCGYKLIQYMACGLPVIASPVGANRQIVDDGRVGFLADSATVWHTALARLCDDAALRRQLGASGRRKVEALYCYQVTARRLAGWLHAIAHEQRS
jgi:glycosyltransferase involved in cell wall biosynthesis